MPGKKGWRSPQPKWWVDHANERLAKRGIEKKALAARLQKAGRHVSEMMVLRALHPEESKRVATIETIDAISDALGLPRPVVVAETFAEALELQSAVSFSAADADRLRIESEVAHQETLRGERDRWSGEGDGRRSKSTGALERSRTRTPKS